MLHDINIELQGKNKTVIDVISSVNTFKRKLQYLSSKLQCHDLANFKNLASELEMQGKVGVQLHSARYTEQIKNCLSLTNTFKILFYWSQLLHSCVTLSGRCWGWFTQFKNVNTVSPELFWSGGWDFYPTGWHSTYVQGSWTVLELTHRGKVPQHEEMCYLIDCIMRLHLFMRVSLVILIINIVILNNTFVKLQK